MLSGNQTYPLAVTAVMVDKKSMRDYCIDERVRALRHIA